MAEVLTVEDLNGRSGRDLKDTVVLQIGVLESWDQVKLSNFHFYSTTA